MRALNDCRVLLVEDEALVAMDMETTLDDAGCVVIGPMSNVMDAVVLVGQEPPDVAVLDVNLNGEKAFPVADALTAAGIPFIWLTGHSPDMIPYEHRMRPLVTKPFLRTALIAALLSALGERRHPAAGAAG